MRVIARSHPEIREQREPPMARRVPTGPVADVQTSLFADGPAPSRPAGPAREHAVSPVAVARDPARPAGDAWRELRDLTAGCRNCELWRNATQAVFGEGPVPARALLVGEQPGDKEDRAGRPFVGPAGRVLDEALAELGVDRGELYVTNVVKHFKWTPSGSVRIHKTPNTREVHACQPWFESELSLVRPELLVCLGAVAAKALLGPQFRLTEARGGFVASPLAPHVTATVHPSSILRTRDDRDAAMAAFVADLRAAFSVLT
jgi:uracil-DNA glycosylase family protein